MTRTILLAVACASMMSIAQALTSVGGGAATGAGAGVSSGQSGTNTGASGGVTGGAKVVTPPASAGAGVSGGAKSGTSIDTNQAQQPSIDLKGGASGDASGSGSIRR
jgi:hypothetical protein